MTRNLLLSLALVSSLAAVAPIAQAQANNDPPPAGAILDLNGQTVDQSTAVSESVNFTAAVSSTDITFAFREDPAFISFGDVSLVDLTHPSSNLILNGNFSSGSVGTQSATDWTYDNVFGAADGGTVETSGTACGGGLTTCWYDGAVQAYDAIDQFVATTVGDQYQLSFLYTDNSGLSNFSDLSTNGNTTGTGGNGIDILAYAQAGLPPAGGATPEPSTFVTLGSGVLSLAGLVRARRKRIA